MHWYDYTADDVVHLADYVDHDKGNVDTHNCLASLLADARLAHEAEREDDGGDNKGYVDHEDTLDDVPIEVNVFRSNAYRTHDEGHYEDEGDVEWVASLWAPHGVTQAVD